MLDGQFISVSLQEKTLDRLALKRLYTNAMSSRPVIPQISAGLDYMDYNKKYASISWYMAVLGRIVQHDRWLLRAAAHLRTLLRSFGRGRFLVCAFFWTNANDGDTFQRFCRLRKEFQQSFEKIARDTYNTIHRFDITKLRNMARFIGHLLFTDAISWEVSCLIIGPVLQ